MWRGFSWKFRVISLLSQIDGISLVQIHTKFHHHTMSFIQILIFVFHAGTWHGFWTRASHGISRAFAKKVMGFSSHLVSCSTKLSSKSHEKIPVTILTGGTKTFSRRGTIISYTSCTKCDRDFLLTSWLQFGREWDQIWWKSHHFLGKAHGNSMTWTCPKSMSCSSMEKQTNPG